MNRRISVISAAVMCLLTLPACGPRSSDSPPSQLQDVESQDTITVQSLKFAGLASVTLGVTSSSMSIRGPNRIKRLLTGIGLYALGAGTLTVRDFAVLAQGVDVKVTSTTSAAVFAHNFAYGIVEASHEGEAVLRYTGTGLDQLMKQVSARHQGLIPRDVAVVNNGETVILSSDIKAIVDTLAIQRPEQLEAARELLLLMALPRSQVDANGTRQVFTDAELVAMGIRIESIRKFYFAHVAVQAAADHELAQAQEHQPSQGATK